jgi:hypothetical protein
MRQGILGWAPNTPLLSEHNPLIFPLILTEIFLGQMNNIPKNPESLVNGFGSWLRRLLNLTSDRARFQLESLGVFPQSCVHLGLGLRIRDHRFLILERKVVLLNHVGGESGLRGEHAQGLRPFRVIRGGHLALPD